MDEKQDFAPIAAAMPEESLLESSAPRSARRPIVTTLLKMALFYCLALAVMGAHLSLFLWLNGKPVKTAGISQSIETAMASFLALVAELLLVSGVGIAYNQILWRFFRQKTLSAFVIDKLVSLPDSPWDLVRPRVITSANGPWLVALVCVLMPLAGMFPPGTLTVEFRNNVLPMTLSNVPTLNISDWGKGDYRGFVDHALFDLDADANSRMIQPRLVTLARTVLAQGEPVAPPTPCNGPCTYTMRLDGPQFKCEEIDVQKVALFTPCIGMIFAAESQSYEENQVRVFNNSLLLTWHTETIASERCDPSTLRSMNCSMSLATYDIRMTNDENGTRLFETNIVNGREIWDDKNPIQLSFYDYFYNRTVGDMFETPVNQSQLQEVFSHTQAYSISEAAVQALNGNVTQFGDGGGESAVAWLWPRDTLAVGSPYIGMVNRSSPRIHVSPRSVQSYLQDLVISTLSLNPRNSPLWTNGPDIEGLEGGETFVFKAKRQFYAPYAACLLVAALIYAAGICALWKNGEPAGKSFLQFVTAVGTSKALQDLGEDSNAQKGGEASNKLKNLQLRYGVGRSTRGKDTSGYVAGFGTADEVE